MVQIWNLYITKRVRDATEIKKKKKNHNLLRRQDPFHFFPIFSQICDSHHYLILCGLNGDC